MASGPYPDPRRGTWAVQWFNGRKWTRSVVVKRRPGWKPGDSMPKNPPAEAKAALAEYIKKEEKARQQQGYHPERLLDDFLDEHLESYKVGHQQASVDELRKAIAIFREWCKEHRVKTLEDMTAEIANRWVMRRASTKALRSGRLIEQVTIKKEAALLATAWSSGLKLGLVVSNPWAAIALPGKATTKKRGSWTPEEYQKLIEACNPWLRDFLIVGCHTGFRVEALCGLEWRDIRYAADGQRGLGHLNVRPELDKAGKGYEVPIHPQVHEVLGRRFLHHHYEHERILATATGRPIGLNNVTHRAIVRACERAKLKKPDSPNHHCRRTFGRWAVLGHLTGKPVPMYVVSRWFGHASQAMTARYLDMNEADSSAFMMGEAE